MSTALPPSDGDRPAEGASADESAAGETTQAVPAAPEAPRRAPRTSAGSGAPRATRTATSKAAGAAGTAKATGAAKAAGAAKTTSTSKPADDAKAPAAAKPARSASAPKKTPTPRTRRTTTKPAAIAPEGEAPGIMDATLGAREPLAPEAAAPESAPAVAEQPAASDTSSSPAEPLADAEAGSADAAPTKRLPTAEELYARPASTTPTAATTATTAAAAVPAETVAETPTPATARPAGATNAPVHSAEAAQAPAAVPAGSIPDALPTERIDTGDAELSNATTEGATPGPVGAADATHVSAPGDPEAHGASHAQAPYGRTVNDLADRLDDSRFFSSLFDFTFTSYVTRKLAGPVYVVGLVLIGLGIVVGFANSLTSAIATHAPIGAFVFLFGVLITLVGAMLSVLLLRVGIEVFCAIIEIAQNTRRRRPPGE